MTREPPKCPLCGKPLEAYFSRNLGQRRAMAGHPAQWYRVVHAANPSTCPGRWLDYGFGETHEEALEDARKNLETTKS